MQRCSSDLPCATTSHGAGAGSPTQLCGELEIMVRTVGHFLLPFLLCSLKLGRAFFFLIHPFSILPYRPSFLIVLAQYFTINKKILGKDGTARAKTRPAMHS